MTHKIGILSDTHDLLRAEVLFQLKNCEAILHGGDISSRKTYEQLAEIAPVHAVQGNADEKWADFLPVTLELELYGIHFFLTHKKKMIPKDLHADIVIYGHSHKYTLEEKDGCTYLNPGSCGPRRFHQPITMALMEIANGKTRIQKIEIPHAASQSTEDLTNVTTNLVKLVCSDVKKGISIEEISRKRRIDFEITEQITRMYLTHPGVTPEQILGKMGL